MKHFIRHIFICLFVIYGSITYASHVLGGEISYKHVKDNQYKVTVKIYRDCNGCKINGYGGGSSQEDCSEVDFLYVKGKNSSGYKETKFALTREKIVEISPICKTRISACRSNSNSLFGIEMHQFTANIDLDDARIKDMCNYYLYVAIAERNSNITTGQAAQNFCVDAFINACLKAENNSSGFESQPVFILNGNKSQTQSYFSIDKDGDSLVYQLTPALSGIDKEATYNSGFSSLSPLSVYCPETPCVPNKSKETGFFIDNSNGSSVFIPVKEGERAVIVVKVSEYRKIKNVWELVGYTKRDIQVYVKTGDGNNSPKFITSDYFEVCEEDQIEIKIETKDEQNNLTMQLDTNYFSLITDIQGSSLTENAQSSAPFNHALFKWKPSKGASSKGLYTFGVSAKDNFCLVSAESIQIITIKVKPKEAFTLNYTDIGCGNFVLNASQINSKSKLLIKLFTLDKNKEIFRTNNLTDTVSFLPAGKFLLEATLLSVNGCETRIIDTLRNLANKTSSYIIGDSALCETYKSGFTIGNIINQNSEVRWFFNSANAGTGIILSKSFLDDGLLQAVQTYQKGKWFCRDTLSTNIRVIKLPVISGPDEIRVCHNSGNFNLNEFSFTPANGVWTSNSPLVNGNFINTNGSYIYYDDTLSLTYEVVNDFNCRASKKVSLIVQAVPEFELSSISICDMVTPILFSQLIKKPYNITDYNYIWGLEFNPENIKEENGNKVFYSKDLGNGKHTYFGEIEGNNGCKNYDTAVIDITAAISIKIKNEINLCQESGPVNISQISGITPAGGNWSFYDFELIKNKYFAQTDTCGEYEVTYTYDNYGCYDSKKINISIACKPEIQIKDFPSEICDSKLPLPLKANPNGGIWQGDFIAGSTFLPPVSNEIKSYRLIYNLGIGDCIFKEIRQIDVIPSPVINLAPDKLNYCKDEPISLSGYITNTRYLTINYSEKKDSLNYEIQDSKDFINEFISNGIFNKTGSAQFIRVIALHQKGCRAKKDLVINIFDKPQIHDFKDTFFCENANNSVYPSINYDGNEPLLYSWIENNLEIDKNKDFNAGKLSSGNHLLIFKASNLYCADSKSINLEIKPKPFVDFRIKPGDRTTIMQPDFWFINESGLNQSWLWNFGNNRPGNFSTEESPKYSYSDTGNYLVSLTGTDQFGCSGTISKTVMVRPDILIFIPNAFSPNNKDEEKNNVFSISLDNYNTYSIEIYNRWGHKVFYSENPTETWDGKSGNVACTPDIYFYLIKIYSISSNEYKYRGTITLIK